jgi:hypothetical protein
VAATTELFDGVACVVDDGGAALVGELARIKAEATAHVDATAETARLLWLTPGSGQSLVYSQKREEAQAFLAAYPTPPATEPPASDWPLLEHEVGPELPSLFAVATAILAVADEWTAAAGEIERLRLGAKRAIATATTPADAWALAAITWPIP